MRASYIIEYNSITGNLDVYHGMKRFSTRRATPEAVELLISVIEDTVDAERFECHREKHLILVKWH